MGNCLSAPLLLVVILNPVQFEAKCFDQHMLKGLSPYESIIHRNKPKPESGYPGHDEIHDNKLLYLFTFTDVFLAHPLANTTV